MPVRLPRTEAALEDCGEHLQAVAAAAPHMDTSAVSAYLATHVAIVLCAEVEDTVRGYLSEIIDADACTGRVREWAKPRTNDVRNATFKGLRELIAFKWDETLAARFEATALNAGIDDAKKSRLGNVVKARNDSSHAGGATVTFSEVAIAAGVACEILAIARTTMGLP